MALIGKSARRRHIDGMKRLRALSALLSCLAVLAAGLANVAAAKDSGWTPTERDASSAPCSHCDDCDKTPCPMPMTDCVQVHAGGSALVLAAFVALPQGLGIAERWAPAAQALSGLSPPPDPLPPRA
jgi:hypothetical protein